MDEASPQNFFQKVSFMMNGSQSFFSLLLPVVPTKSFSSSFSGHAKCAHITIEYVRGMTLTCQRVVRELRKGSKEEEI